MESHQLNRVITLMNSLYLLNDISIDRIGIPVMDKSNSEMNIDKENVTIMKEGTKVPLFNGPNILATPLINHVGTSEDSDWQPQESFGSVSFSTNENDSNDKVIGTIELEHKKDYADMHSLNIGKSAESSEQIISSEDSSMSQNAVKGTEPNGNVNSEVKSNNENEHEDNDLKTTPKGTNVINPNPPSRKEEGGPYGHHVQEGNLDITKKKKKNLQTIGLKVKIYCIQLFKLINFKNIIRFIFLPFLKMK